MAFVVGKGVAKIGVDLSDFNRGLSQAHSALMRFAGFSASSPLGAGLVVAGGAAQALAGGLFRSVQFAGDLNESINKLGVVFGQDSNVILGTAAELATRFGMVRREVIEAAAGFGAMLRASGLTRQEAAKTSDSMVKLAADIASVHNIPLDTALQKLQAGLAGQSRPLRSLGAMLTVANVKAEAVNMGLAKKASQVSESDKVKARASIAMRQLGYTQGDLERTAGAPMNRQREILGRIQNGMTSLGQAVMPVWKEILNQVNDGIKDLTAWFERNRDTIRVWAAYGVQGVKQVAEWLRKIADAALPALGDALMIIQDAWTDLPYTIATAESYFWEFAEDAQIVVNSIRDAISTFLGWFSVNWRKVLIDSVGNTFGELIKLSVAATTDIRQAFLAMIPGVQMGNAFANAFADAVAGNMKQLQMPQFADKGLDRFMIEEKRKINRLMRDRERARIRANLKPADLEEQEALGQEGKFEGPEELPSTNKHKGFLDAAQFARKLQESVFGKDVQTQILAESKKSNEHLQDIAANQKKPKPPVAAVAGAPA